MVTVVESKVMVDQDILHMEIMLRQIIYKQKTWWVFLVSRMSTEPRTTYRPQPVLSLSVRNWTWFKGFKVC